jgi:hypothetical protein
VELGVLGVEVFVKLITLLEGWFQVNPAEHCARPAKAASIITAMTRIDFGVNVFMDILFDCMLQY